MPETVFKSRAVNVSALYRYFQIIAIDCRENLRSTFLTNAIECPNFFQPIKCSQQFCDWHLKMGHSRPFFVFSTQLTVNKCSIKVLLMTRLEPWISGVGGNCSTNWATTTADCDWHFVCWIWPWLLFHLLLFFLSNLWSKFVLHWDSN